MCHTGTSTLLKMLQLHVVGAGGCACVSESVGCTYVDGVCICIMSYRFGLVCVLRSCVLVCTCVLV